MYQHYRQNVLQDADNTNSTKESSKSLHEAVMSDPPDSWHHLLEERDVLKQRDTEGATALYRAAESGNLEAVTTLIQAGAHVNARKRKRWTPLHISAKNNHVEVVKKLVDANGDVNRCTNREMTPLMLAAKHASVQAMEYLIERSDLKTIDRLGRTLIHWAIKGGDIDILKMLIDHGSDIHTDDKFRKSPVIQSVKSDRPDMLKYLLKLGGDPLYEEKHFRSSMHIAACKGRPECLQVLLQHGISPDVLTSAGRTPLQFAAREIRYGSVKVLLENGANINLADGFGTTPLHEIAVASRLIFPSHPSAPRKRKPKLYFDTAFLLIRANADLDALTSANLFWRRGENPPQNALELAVKAGKDPGLVYLLALAGSSPNNLFQLFEAPPTDLPAALRKDPVILKWLQDFYSQPRKLKEFCRISIRKAMSASNFDKKLVMWDIAPAVRNYLGYSDLTNLVNDHSLLSSGEYEDFEEDRNSEAEYEPSIFESEYGDDPNIIDTDDETANAAT